jgi:aspartyl-tRNA(Asn)/glutamyl-tRNA(Gln) amidotransferase subunit B
LLNFAALANSTKYQLVIGLEVHAQLLTRSKLFCGDSAAFGTGPNINVSPITLAHPGTLPKMNRRVIDHAVKLGLALNCTIEQHNYFARKNYFYPDLPKGYQVSQHTTPICRMGYLEIKTADAVKKVLLNRIHIEEDAGKSLHEGDEQFSSIDLNRAGVPLLEIVTEPCLYSADDAFIFLTELRRLLRWLEICDGNMEEGSMRCDANISVRPDGESKLGTRVEVKNLNSIRNVKKAIEVEAARLIALAETGTAITQETRSFDADTDTTFSLRTKEDADDYRYFPEPDLTPFHISNNFLEDTRRAIPELPAQLEERYTRQFNLSAYDARVICDDREQALFFEAIIEHNGNYKAAANWLLGPVKNYLNETNTSISSFKLAPRKIAELIGLVDEGKVSFGNASAKIFPVLLQDTSKDALQVAADLDLLQQSDTNSLENWVNEALAKMPDKVAEYKKGKKGLLGLFAGEVKKISKGRADMQAINKILEEKLKT